MKAVKCPYCGGPTKRNGRTSSGAQRWRCTACGASTTVRYDDTAARFDEFLSWLLSKDTQLEMPGAGRTFRRRTAEFWEVWPMPVPDGEFHRVLFVDGIWLAERLVVLICCSEDRVVSWHMAQSENSRAWSVLMEPIPAPDVVVTDGGSGFAKAVRAAWPRTKVQRCLFHAYVQVKRCTTTRPKLQAGRELYQIALDLMHIETLHQAELWRERYLDWCGFWADFLEDTTLVDGRRAYTHERLRKARRSLSSLVSAGTLFTYLDPELTKAGPLPYTNNKIEGGVNAQLRAILRNHRGLTSLKRVKAISGGATRIPATRGPPGRSWRPCRGTPISTCSTTSIRHPGSTTTGGRNGAIGPFGKNSTAKTHSRFGSIDNREHMFRRDTHFVL